MRILITEASSYSKKAIDIYRQLGEVILIDSDLEEVQSHLPEIDVLVVKLRFNWSESLLSRAKLLKYIVTSTTGLNHIKLPLNSDIKVVSLKGEVDFLRTITPTAELTWGLIISLMRNLPAAINGVKALSWDRNQYIGQELFGKTIGIVGYGRLGSIIAKYAVAFGLSVKVFDCELGRKNCLPEGVEFLDLDTLLKTSDIVTLHIPLVESNINFINANRLTLMKKTAVLVNTSRGEILDEMHLLNMLEQGLLSGAALDVLSDEVSGKVNWMQGNELVNSNKLGGKLLITPHIGGACFDSMKRTEEFVAKKLMSEVSANYSA